jgi:NAD(P)-dependent dehydrogenase (short-subunit alcohol dehydrogenase family)
MKTWFITGCSTGFGRDLATAALKRGHRVAVTARNPDAVADIVALEPERALQLAMDVTDPAQVTAAVRAAEARFGGIDVLVNNAGIGYFAAVEESSWSEVRRMFEINVFALADVTNKVLPGMRARRSGTIVNISSVGGVRAFPAVGWYNASKFAVEGLSEALRQETQPLGIDILLVEPSGFATNWAGASANETGPDHAIEDYQATAGENRRQFRLNAGKEAGDPERAAAAILEVVDSGDLPDRLPLGNFAYDGILEHLDHVRTDIQSRELVSRGADRPDAA